MIQFCIESEGVEEIFQTRRQNKEIDLFSDDYLAKIRINCHNTKFKLLKKY